jgi:ankyrin repeat protein
VELIDLLITAGADPTKSGSKHRATPLHHAVKYCGPAVLRKLLEAGADPNRRFRGESAAHLAVNLPTMRNWNCLFKWLQKNGLDLAPVSW